ncbi:MAG: sulfotransferase [Micromonosporaceae bacterium]|nr:sulfotransferase [Micromonosporaceae bacterium]
MSPDRPIFVVGFPRSGTTMLQLMLHAHPRIAIPPESRFVISGYQQRRQFGDLRDPARRRALAKWIVSKKTFRDLRLDASEVTEEIVAGPPTLGSAFGIVFRSYARRFGKARWGDKRPAYLHALHIITSLFPDAQIVHLVRDGRDAVASVMEMTWNTRDFYQSVAAWNEGVDHGRWAARTLGPDSYHEIRYEHLVADPAAELKQLCAFLGEEFDPAMTEPATVASVAVPKRKAWHERTHGSVDSARVSSYQQRLEPWQIALCEDAMGSRLRGFGYQLSGAPKPALEHRLRYLRAAARNPVVRPKRALDRFLERLGGAASVASQL